MLDYSYKEYLQKTGKKDSRESWIDWKVEICGMDYEEARIASIDPDWGWEEGLGE
ncbi:hypothetical protein [Anaerovorax sp. IOR16]|uniref:hypothetical protein n=1 Tax=Anaerovorax sp. IOR16 TaxID=2773458 RepID=UPI0019CFF8B8|nr:hypothetical protein [Anaerovorax sp. IOR16]